MGTDTWLGSSADWTSGAGWSTGAAPASGDTAVINAQGNYAVTLFGTASVAGLALGAAGAEFYDAGILTVAGTLALQAGTLALAYGSIHGGTLALGGGVLQSTGGTLDGVAVQGALNLSAAGATMFVKNGLALSGAGGGGPGSIAVTGGYASLDFVGSQTVNNATISLGATGGLPGQGGPATLGVSHAGSATAGATLTLGPALWLRQVGSASVSSLLAVGSTSPLPGATLPDVLVNQGTITAGVANAIFDIAGSGNFANRGTIAVSNGATLQIATAGFSNSGTISVSNATLALGGSFAASRLSNLGSVVLSTGQVEILGTASNTGGTLALGMGSALGALGPIALAGTILNGTVLDAGNGLSFAPGTGVLDGVTYAGTLALSGAGAGVTLTDGARVMGAGGAAGSVVDTGAGASLLLRGSETLDNVNIQLGSTSGTASISTNDIWLASSGTTATLGAHATVQQAGLYAALQANGWSPVAGVGASDTLVNQGVITGAVAGGRLSVSGYGTFINQGTIALSGGDTLAVTVGQFANAGVISVASGSTVLLGQPAPLFGTAPAWSNAGSINVSGGTLVLGGAMSTAQLGTISESSGSVVLAGTLSNAGATLTLGTQAGGLNLAALTLSGTVLGGTINDAAGLLQVGASGSALLDGVSYLGTLALSQAGAFLRIRDGLNLNGLAEVLGAGSALGFQGSQVVDHAQILLGAAGAAASIGLIHDSGSSGPGSSGPGSSGPGSSGPNTLTLGSSLVITQAGQLAAIGRPGGTAGDVIVNAGTINAATIGGTLTIGGSGFVNQGMINVGFGETLSVTSPNFSNTGSIAVNGGILSLAGSVMLAGLGQVTLSGGVLAVAGTLDLGGGTLALGQGSAIGRLGLTGTLRNGIVIDAGGGLAFSAAATLDAITYDGTLDLSRPFAQVSVAHGLTVQSLAGGQPGSIVLTGGQSRLIATTSETFDNTAISLGSVSQYYVGQRIAPPELAAAAGVQLTLGAGVALTLAGTAGVLGDATLGQWSDSIVNAGTISAATSLGTLSIGSSFIANTGSIAAASSANIVFDDTALLNSGTISVGAGSAVQVLLYDYYAAPNAGASVFTNTGTIALQGGIFQEPTANGLFPAVPISNLAGASIQGYGLLFAQVNNAGTIEAHGGTLQLAQPVFGTGSLVIDPGATLEIEGPQPAGQVIRFGGPGSSLKLDQPSIFAGTLSGFAPGDTLDLPGTALIGVGSSSGTLVASTATQNFRFTSNVPLGGEISAGLDAHGGAAISFQPQAPGSAQVTVGVSQPGMLFWASPFGDEFQGTAGNLTGAHIGNWSAADSIDVTDLASGSATLTVAQGTGLETLRITDGTHALGVTLGGTYPASFHVASDGHGGTLLTYG